MIHTVKGFSVVTETEVDVFLEFPCFLCDPVNFDNLISGSSAFSKSILYIWKFSVHVLVTLQACEISAIVRQFEHSLALPSFGTGMKTVSNSAATAEFSKLADILSAAL